MSNEDTSTDSSGFSAATTLTTVVNQTGFPATIKGRVQKLVSQIILGTVAHPAYAQLRERLDEVEGRSRINMMVAEEIGRQAIADPEFMARAKSRLMGETLRKQENVEAVGAEALRIGAEAADSDREAPISEEPSQDWLNSFMRYAEDASGDELRKRLATLLAGEARAPGTFSRSTLRVVAEMDTETVQIFQRYLAFKCNDIIPINESFNNGPDFVSGIRLESEGLIYGSGATTSRIIKLDESGVGIIKGDKLCLIVKGSGGHQFQNSAWFLTKIGKEMSQLLPPQNEVEALKRYVGLMDKGGLTEITLGIMLPSEPGKILANRIEVLWKVD